MLARCLCSLLIAACLLGAESTYAAEPSDYSGRFEPLDMTKATQDKEAAVKEVAEDLPKLFQGMVRSRLGKAASIAKFLTFSGSENRMSISSDQSTEWTTDLSATEAQFTNPQGKGVTMARWMSEGVLCTRAQGERGTRSGRFELSTDGLQLWVETTIETKNLPRPLVYRTEYRRVQSAKDPAGTKLMELKEEKSPE